MEEPEEIGLDDPDELEVVELDGLEVEDDEPESWED